MIHAKRSRQEADSEGREGGKRTGGGREGRKEQR
jgi:hypothetical protein